MNPDTLRDALLVLLIVSALVVVLRFERACLRDLADTPDVCLRVLTRPAWRILIVMLIPIGGICYLYYGKDR